MGGQDWGGPRTTRLFLRVSEVADALNVSRSTAYDLIQRGQIPSVRLEGRGGRGILRVPADALLRLAELNDSRTLPERGTR